EGDTLLYTSELTASINLWKLHEGQAIIKRLTLMDSRFFVKRDSNHTNLTFLIDYFRKTPTKKKSGKGIKLDVRAITLANMSIGYTRVGMPSVSSGIDFNNIQLTEFNADFTDI